MILLTIASLVQMLDFFLTELSFTNMDHVISPIAWNFSVLKVSLHFLKILFSFLLKNIILFSSHKWSLILHMSYHMPVHCYQPIYWRLHILELKMWLELETGLWGSWLKNWMLVKAKLISLVSWDFWCLWSHNNNRAGAHRERSRDNNDWEATLIPGEGLQKEVTVCSLTLRVDSRAVRKYIAVA